jgi:hypothetical protein
MKTDDLIDNLTKDHKKVEVVVFNSWTIFKLSLSILFSVGAAVAILGLRFDIQSQLHRTHFLVESLVLLVLAVLSCASALLLSIPGQQTKVLRRLPILTLFAWLGLLIYAATRYPYLPAGWGFACVADIVGLSIVPAGLLFYFIRKAAPLKRDRIGFLILLSAASYGAFGTQLICYISSPLHLLVWHLLPTVLIAFLGIYLGRRFIIKI